MAKYTAEDIKGAEWTIQNALKNGGTILIVRLGGNAHSVEFVGKDGTISHLTYSLGVAMGWSVRNKNGRNSVSVSGYGFSKSDYLAQRLADCGGFGNERSELFKVVTL